MFGLFRPTISTQYQSRTQYHHIRHVFEYKEAAIAVFTQVTLPIRFISCIDMILKQLKKQILLEEFFLWWANDSFCLSFPYNIPLSGVNYLGRVDVPWTCQWINPVAMAETLFCIFYLDFCLIWINPVVMAET